MFGVITGANAATLSSNVYDAFVAQQYVPVPSKHPAECFIAMSEPNMLTGSGGRGVVVPSRGFQVMGKKPGPTVAHTCSNSGTLYQGCMLLCQLPKYTACKPLGPIFGKICKWDVHVYCEHYCKNLVKWKPFGKCAQECSTAPTGQCEDCCNSTCHGTGAKSKCYNMCATR